MLLKYVKGNENTKDLRVLLIQPFLFLIYNTSKCTLIKIYAFTHIRQRHQLV